MLITVERKLKDQGGGYEASIRFTRLGGLKRRRLQITDSVVRWLSLQDSRMCVCVFFTFILDIKFVGRTSRGHTGGRSHRISRPPSFCGACLNFYREKDSAFPFPRRPWSRIVCTNDLLIVLHPFGIYFLFFIFEWEKSRLPGSNSRPNVSEGYMIPLSYPGRPAMGFHICIVGY